MEKDKKDSSGAVASGEKPKKPRKEPFGRPTKYREDFPQKMIDYFKRPMWQYEEIEVATAKGVQKITQKVPCEPPFVEGFCEEIMISKRTFYDWVEKYPDFSHAFSIAKQAQANRLANHAMLGGYNSSISKLILANCTDYKEDKSSQTESTVTLKYEIGDEKK
jgi:hypothetical protein